jgi:hypothetical protein
MAAARKEVTLVQGSMACRMNICETLVDVDRSREMNPVIYIGVSAQRVSH